MSLAKKNRKWVIAIAAVFLAVLAIAVSFIAYGYRLLNSTQKIPGVEIKEMPNENISQEAEEAMEGYWTIALFGVDSRDGNLDKGTLSDVEMICNIDRKTGEIRLVSVYRDTFLNINQKNRYDKINQAYLQGGAKQAISALQENLDLKFDDYATFNWKAVADAINILGGIDIEITKDEFRLINGFITETVESTGIPSSHLKSAGLNHLDGVQAVAYARLRKLDTDFKRTERQRTVIKLAMEKARNADWAVINNIIVTVLPQISTSVYTDDIIPMARNIKRYHLGNTGGFPFEHSGAVIDGKDCVIPESLESNVTELHEFLFGSIGYTPSKRVQEISNKIKELRAAAKIAGTAAQTEETYETSETGEDETPEFETDGNGEIIYPGEDGILDNEDTGNDETDELPEEELPEEELPDDDMPQETLPEFNESFGPSIDIPETTVPVTEPETESGPGALQ